MQKRKSSSPTLLHATPRQTFNATTPDGAVQIGMLFQDSGFVDDWVLASRPVHTLAVTATSLDGKSHTVQASATRDNFVTGMTPKEKNKGRQVSSSLFTLQP